MTSLRTRILLCIAVAVPAGFCVKFYPGPGSAWFNAYGAAVVYEVFWCLAAFLVFPSRRSVPVIAAAVFFFTCALELMQLWHPPLLETIRRFPPGAWLIGTSFDWLDYPHYVFGCGLGWLLMNTLRKSSSVPAAGKSLPAGYDRP